MVLRTIFTTNSSRQPHQIGELLFVLGVQDPLLRSKAEGDFLAALKSSRIMRNSCLGKFKPMAPERN
jgi:hypothetical protein